MGPLAPALACAHDAAATAGAALQAWTLELVAALRASQARPTLASWAYAASLVAVLPLVPVVPMTLVCLAVAVSLPALPAAAAILCGVAANTVVSWVLARTVFGARIEAWLEGKGGWLGAVHEGARQAPLKWALLARYVPAPFVAAPMVLSSTGVGLGTTLAGSLLGMLPWTALYLYVARAGMESSLPGISRAVAALALGYILLGVLRGRLTARPKARPLKPRRGDKPLLVLYTLPGQDLSEEARLALGPLRDALGFEVEERPLVEGGDPGWEGYRDHAPVAFLEGERLFNYAIDEAVLKERLGRLKRTAEKP